MISALSLKQRIKPFVPVRVRRFRRRVICAKIARKQGVQVTFHRAFIEIAKGSKSIRISHENETYLNDMVSCFDYYFGSVEPVVINKKFVVDFSAPMHHKLHGFDDFPLIFPSMSEPYQTVGQYLDFARLDEGHVVIDLGAYAGVTSIAFAKKVSKTGRVLAFEPDAKNRVCAEENIKKASDALGLSNISLFKEAVWSHCNGICFSTEGGMGSSASSIVGRGRGIDTIVPTITLEKLCERERLSRIDFIKMDIEGAETEVLESSLDLLSRFRPRILVEPHNVNGVPNLEQCLEILSRISYQTNVIEQLGVILPLIEAVPK